MAEGNGEAAKTKSALVSKKLVAFCLGIVATAAFAFTGKLTPAGAETALLALFSGYFAAQGVIDVVKAAKDKSNGAGQA